MATTRKGKRGKRRRVRPKLVDAACGPDHPMCYADIACGPDHAVSYSDAACGPNTVVKYADASCGSAEPLSKREVACGAGDSRFDGVRDTEVIPTRRRARKPRRPRIVCDPAEPTCEHATVRKITPASAAQKKKVLAAPAFLLEVSQLLHGLSIDLIVIL